MFRKTNKKVVISLQATFYYKLFGYFKESMYICTRLLKHYLRQQYGKTMTERENTTF